MRVMQRQRQRPAHEPGRADRKIKPRQMRHLERGADTPALLADEKRIGLVIFDFARRIRTIAALLLFLEPLDEQAVACAVGQRARNEEARWPLVRLREREERIAHRRGAEPLVTRSRYSAPVPPPFTGAARVAFARRSEPPCFSVSALPIVALDFSVTGSGRGS